MNTDKLSDKQKAFCEEYIVDFNGAQAAIRAGYGKSGAAVQATRLLTNVNIQAYLLECKARRNVRVELDADYVLRRLHALESFDINGIHDDNGNILPPSEWPEGATAIISGLKTKRTTFGTGDDVGETVSREARLEPRIRALELMGKHVQVGAFEKDGLVIPDGVEFHFHLDGKKK